MYVYNSVILLNGVLPQEKIIDKLTGNKTIICTDISPDILKNKGIKPDIVIGDLDSANLKIMPINTKIIKSTCQNTTDFEKAIYFARKNKLTPALILGLSGGQLDHIIANIHILLKHFKYTEEFFFIAADHNNCLQLGVVIDNYWQEKCFPGAKISLLPFTQAIVTVKGVKYPLDKKLIKQTKGILAVRNETIGHELEVMIHKGRVLCVIEL